MPMKIIQEYAIHLSLKFWMSFPTQNVLKSTMGIIYLNNRYHSSQVPGCLLTFSHFHFFRVGWIHSFLSHEVCPPCPLPFLDIHLNWDKKCQRNYFDFIFFLSHTYILFFPSFPSPANTRTGKEGGSISHSGWTGWWRSTWRERLRSGSSTWTPSRKKKGQWGRKEMKVRD